jgi:multiple antibiotic resistance protein
MGLQFNNNFVYELVTLFVILDPVATVPIFLFVTAGLVRKEAIKVAACAVGVAFLVLLFFIAGGQHLLEALHIPMASFQLAGSIVLLMFGLNMVLGKVTKEVAGVSADATLLERAVFPLAIPGIAGAGAILTVVLLTDNNVRTVAEQVITTVELAICLSALFCLYAASSLIFRLLGRSGIEIVSRVFGLIVSSIAVNSMIIAIKLSFHLS